MDALLSKSSLHHILSTPPISPETEDHHQLVVPHTTLSSLAVKDSNSLSLRKRRSSDLLPRDDGKIHKKKSSGLNLSLLDRYLSSGRPMDVKDDRYGLSLLCWACECKSLTAVKKILQRGCIDINATYGPFQRTALHIAAINDFASGIHCMTQQQQQHLDLNKRDIFGLTPLHYTARGNYSISSKALLRAGARLDVFDNDGKLALHFVLHHHHRSSNGTAHLCLLLQGSNKTNNNPSSTHLLWSSRIDTQPCVMEEAVMLAAKPHHQLALIRLLSDEGGAFRSSVEQQGGGWHDKYASKRSKLMDLCVTWNKLECLQYLSSEIKKTTQHTAQQHVQLLYRNALHLAVQQNKLDMVIYLSRVVQVHSCDKNGYNFAFLYAASHGFVQMVPYLITPDTSFDCVRQALLFSQLIGLEKEMKAVLKKTYYTSSFSFCGEEHYSSSSSSYSTTTDSIDSAFVNIFQQVDK